MPNSIYVNFFCFGLEIPFLEKLFKVKPGALSQNNLNMQNSLVMFTFLVFVWSKNMKLTV